MEIIGLLFPPRCSMCGDLMENNRHSAFCRYCTAKWESEKNECRLDNLGQPVIRFSPNDKTNGRQWNDKTDGGQKNELYVAFLSWYRPDCHENATASFLLRMKSHITRNIADFAADELAQMLRQILREVGEDHVMITYIPRSKKALRQCGYDHMEMTAKALAERMNMPFRSLLYRKGRSLEQKKLGYLGRMKNAAGTMFFNGKTDITGWRIVLIDDIVTSGASMMTCSSALLKAGAAQVICVALAATYRM